MTLKLQDHPKLLQKLTENTTANHKSADISDVTFVVGVCGTRINAVRGVFAMHSPYFKKLLFASEECRVQKEFVESDVTVVAFQYIHEFFWRLNPSITMKNVFDIANAAQKYDLTELLAICIEFVNNNLDSNPEKGLSFLNEESFLTAPKEIVCSLIQSDKFSVQEEHIWLRCQQWCFYQMQNKTACFTEHESKESESALNWQTLMKDFVPYLRFSLMNSQYFGKVIIPSQVLELEQIHALSLHFITDGKNHEMMKFNTKPRTNFDYKMYDYCVNPKFGVRYTLHASSIYSASYANCFQGLIRDNLNGTDACATGSGTNEYVMCLFGGMVSIKTIQIGAMGPSGNWGEGYTNSRILQYRDIHGTWVNVPFFENGTITGLKQEIETFRDLNLEMSAFRITKSSGYVAIGCLRFFNDSCVAYCTELLPYTLSQSSSHELTANTYESLIDGGHLNTGCATTAADGAHWIQATFADDGKSTTHIQRMDICPPSADMPGGEWTVAHMNGLIMQYKSVTDGNKWHDWPSTGFGLLSKKFVANKVLSMDVDIRTSSVRILNDSGVVALGCWRLYGNISI